jgi:hypothetical protein
MGYNGSSKPRKGREGTQWGPLLLGLKKRNEQGHSRLESPGILNSSRQWLYLDKGADKELDTTWKKPATQMQVRLKTWHRRI